VSNLIPFEHKAFAYKFMPAPNVRKTFALPSKDEEETIIGSSTSSRADTVDPDTNAHHEDTTSKSKAAASKSKAAASKSQTAASKSKATASKSQKVLNRSQTDDESDEPDFSLDFSGSEEQDEDEEDDEDKDDEEDDEDEDDEDDARPLAKQKLVPSPKSKQIVIDQYKDWDNGETLTPAQRAYVMALGSNYERAQMMNKLRNARMLQEMKINDEVSDLFGDLMGSAKQADEPKHKLKGKEKVTGARKTTR
jgi:hypothetical protein